jgi:hypothetical protein
MDGWAIFRQRPAKADIADIKNRVAPLASLEAFE